MQKVNLSRLRTYTGTTKDGKDYILISGLFWCDKGVKAIKEMVAEKNVTTHNEVRYIQANIVPDTYEGSDADFVLSVGDAEVIKPDTNIEDI